MRTHKFYFVHRQDVLNIFKEPVSSEKVPDYYDVIKNPMDFQTMKNKIDDQKYETEKQFIVHLFLSLMSIIITKCLLTFSSFVVFLG